MSRSRVSYPKLPAALLPLGLLAVSWVALSPARAADECPDAWITSKVKSKLAVKHPISTTFKLNVETENCVVTLKGCMETSEQRADAGKRAASVKRVKAVKNELTVCPKKE